MTETMGANSTSTPSLRKLKILMLHGYTQSGPLFRSKTRALEKALLKAFPQAPPSPHNKSKSHPSNTHPFPGGVSLIYPTAPIRLRPADIPGYQSTNEGGDAASEETDNWGWWVKDNNSTEYKGLSEGLETIREAIEEAGGVDGVIGFSQGGCAASFVASLLEPNRSSSFSGPVSFPKRWEGLQLPLKFAVSYSGFFAPSALYAPFYEPKISTPMLHVIGSLDSVVEESRSIGLAERSEGGKERVVMHPGGHFVPVGKEMAGVLVGFVRECCKGEEKEEESVEDMDVPF
ncbi:dihydrofolate reductase-like protein [Tricladium varicosporioides]|nr:dihydrofolate reductase-like protein [Hymenoscyphus varicosporioides]